MPADNRIPHHNEAADKEMIVSTQILLICTCADTKEQASLN